MRALVIAMVLSLVASGGAFAAELWFDFKDTQATEAECREALSEGKILTEWVVEFDRGNYLITLLSYEGDIYRIEFSEKQPSLNCQKKKLVLR